MKYLKQLSIFIIPFFLTACFIGAGTHGSIKRYRYDTTKDELERAIMTVINGNQNIQRDSISNYIIDKTGGRSDTIMDNSYNDGENYITMKIRSGDGTEENKYTFRFYGDEEHWRKSSSTVIFICYAHDKDGNGGSEGSGGLEWYKSGLKNKLINLFESEFLAMVDKELQLKHIETD